MRDVYTLEDLRNWKEINATLDQPACLAVFGDPIAHSLSPQLQNAALRYYGIPGQYIRIQISESELPEALQLASANGFIGVNLTIPHKTAALSLVQRVDESAKKLGAINTVLFSETGSIGFNTDGPGLSRAIRAEFNVDLRDLRVLVLGAGGGAGRAIATQCAIEECERLVLVNRTVEKAETLKQALLPLFQTERLCGPVERLSVAPWTEKALEHELLQVDLVINASSVGMKWSDPSPLPVKALQPSLLVYDATYSRHSSSRLLEESKLAGARVANGFSMLLHQGAIAFEIWFNRPAPVEQMQSALISA